MKKALAEEVIERAHGLCEVCGREGHHIHHIFFGRHKKINELWSLMFVCFECHEGEGPRGAFHGFRASKKLREWSIEVANERKENDNS